jgi:hypothetical protein
MLNCLLVQYHYNVNSRGTKCSLLDCFFQAKIIVGRPPYLPPPPRRLPSANFNPPFYSAITPTSNLTLVLLSRSLDPHSPTPASFLASALSLHSSAVDLSLSPEPETLASPPVPKISLLPSLCSQPSSLSLRPQPCSQLIPQLPHSAFIP